MSTVTYPPKMLPSPDEGDEVEVIVEHPDTRKRTVVYSTGTPPSDTNAPKETR